VIGTLAVDGQAVIFSTARKGLSGLGPRPVPSLLWVGCYIWYSDEGTGRGRIPPRPILAVPNVTAHPSTASAPITVLLITLRYFAVLMCPQMVIYYSLTVTETAVCRFSVTLNVTCDEGYYDELCNEYCVARDNCTGHYTCDPEFGAVECLPGWTGSNCAVVETNTNFCPSSLPYQPALTSKFLFDITEVTRRPWST